MKGKASVMTAFNAPLEMREYDVSPLAEGEVLIRMRVAGVCGSDVHMWNGNDPRTPVPIILGHEGFGEIAEVRGTRTDIFGRELKPGDLVLWERGIMCGTCYYCVVKKEPSLCPTRQTYGISLSCADPPHFRGCYAEFLHLLPSAKFIKVDFEVDPKVLVPATCAGATAAHTAELCEIQRGDAVVIQGPGPVGLFVLAFALDSGAGEVIVIGTEADRGRLEICKEFGAGHTLVIGDTTLEERRSFVMERTHGIGANVVIDCTGTPKATLEGLRLTAPGGTYALPGIATPVGEVPFKLFEDIARKNVRVQGVWVSDTGHLYQAMRIVQAARYPFEKIVTHTFPLEEATTALEKMHSREAMKAVLTIS